MAESVATTTVVTPGSAVRDPRTGAGVDAPDRISVTSDFSANTASRPLPRPVVREALAARDCFGWYDGEPPSTPHTCPSQNGCHTWLGHSHDPADPSRQRTSRSIRSTPDRSTNRAIRGGRGAGGANAGGGPGLPERDRSRSTSRCRRACSASWKNWLLTPVGPRKF